MPNTVDTQCPELRSCVARTATPRGHLGTVPVLQPYRLVLEQKDLHSTLKVLSSECLQTFCFQDEVLTFDHPGDLIFDSEFFVSGI